MRTLARPEPAFPEGLRSIADAPAAIYFRGSPSGWEPPALAVVGTRTPTASGKSVTRELTEAAVDAGFAIISGLAPGVDAIAHAVAIEAGGRTTAVVASGLDRISRPVHAAELADRIVQAGGALLSELPPGTQASLETRLARNRLQVALADAVVVTETGVEGGTLHTVRFAAGQGKPVYCPVPVDRDGESAGLAVLLETPAEDLPAVLPAWADATALAHRLGRRPLARPVDVETIALLA